MELRPVLLSEQVLWTTIVGMRTFWVSGLEAVV